MLVAPKWQAVVLGLSLLALAGGASIANGDASPTPKIDTARMCVRAAPGAAITCSDR